MAEKDGDHGIVSTSDAVAGRANNDLLSSLEEEAREYQKRSLEYSRAGNLKSATYFDGYASAIFHCIHKFQKAG